MKPYFFVVLMAISTAIILVSCRSREPVNIAVFPKDVQVSLIQAGTNAQELINVIHHYSKYPADSLKLKAAYFLISNMGEWHYYQGEQLDHYQDYFRSVRGEEEWTARFDLGWLISMYGPFSYDNLKLKYDVQEVTKNQLIENIDMAFKVWAEQPWGKNYSFTQFCEFILPLKMGDEIPEYNRSDIYHKYNKCLDSIRKIQGDVVGACTVINNKLHERGWYLLLGTGFLPHFPASKLIRYQAGSCRDQSDLGAYVMRSLGIPVSIDFIPQWPTRSRGHDFNAVIDKNGNPVMFGASDEDPGQCRFMEVPKGKVYRRTIERNKESLALKKDEGESIPGFMRDPYFKDVTDEYVSCLDITIPLLEWSDQYKHAYICLFNNTEWVPVHWGDVMERKVKFTKMEPDLVYLPGYFDAEKIIPGNYPFILQKNGEIKLLIPNTRHLIRSATFKQIFPVLPHFLTKLNGQFQGSNSRDFRNAKSLFNTATMPGLQHLWNTVNVTLNDSFQYVRYYSSWQCNIGEIELYASGKKVLGEIISSGPSVGNNNQFSNSMALDGDVATAFISSGSAPAWVGLHLGRSEKIDSIKFSPGISVFGPKCFVIPGHKYELRYWDHGHWSIIDSSTVRNASITFNNIPSDALYQLHDLTEKTNERIFTIENGRQVWW